MTPSGSFSVCSMIALQLFRESSDYARRSRRVNGATTTSSVSHDALTAGRSKCVGNIINTAPSALRWPYLMRKRPDDVRRVIELHE